MMATATARRKVVDIASRRRQSTKNPRVRIVRANSWQVSRLDLFKGALKFAAAAKSYRTAMGVTQGEVARALGVSGHCITHRESGAYFGWDAKALQAFNKAVDKLAES